MHRLVVPDASRATELSALMRRTFVEAYSGCTSPRNMAAFLEAEYLPHLQQAELESHDMRTWVVEAVDGRWVGFVQVRLSRPMQGVDFERPAQLARIYVEAAYAGHGLGAGLLEQAIGGAIARLRRHLTAPT